VKVIIAGSRTIPPQVGYELVSMAARIARLRGWEITEVVCGTAKGMDTCGEHWASGQGIPVKKFSADWSTGRGGGFKRNAEMAGYADALIAITVGTPGTRNMIQTARARKLPMIVIAASGESAWIARRGDPLGESSDG